MANEEWLDQLQAGDEVAIYGQNTGYAIYTIAKRTPGGQIILENTWRFDKRGREIGGSKWNRRSLSPVTDEIRAEIAHWKLVYRANSLFIQYDMHKLAKLKDTQLHAFIQMLLEMQQVPKNIE